MFHSVSSSLNSTAPFDVCIVGGGACGLAILLQIVERAAPGTRVALFEKNAAVGPGLAYSAACAGTRLNMHASTMSLYANDPDHFVRWTQENFKEISKDDFPMREHYGKYLSALAASAVKGAQERNIDLSTLNLEVLDLESKPSGWTLQLSNGSTVEASKVALALGNFPAALHDNLAGKPLYFDCPWPNSQLLAIPKDASVCILGSRLTAIDQAVFMAENGHTGTISLVSRIGQLPKVQGKAANYDRVFALYNLARELEDSSSSAIITLARRLQDEMETATTGSWFRVAAPDDVLSQFRIDIEHARAGDVPGQAVLKKTAPVIERYWNSLDDVSKQAFLREYMSTWVTHRHAMPLQTAEKILRLLEKGQLRVLRAKKGEPAYWEDGSYIVPTSSDGTLRVDSLIEAIGLEYDPHKVQLPLMKRLLSRGTLKPHVAGGVELDFHTLEAQKGLYVLGSMTRGVHFYSTAIDRNVAHAERLADSILGVPQRKSLHVALFVGSDLYSNLMVSQLVPRLLKAGHVPFVFLPVHKASKRSQLFELREMGFYERQLLQDHVIPYLGSGTDKTGPCMTVEQLRARYGVLVQSVPDVNDADFVRSLSGHHIDLGFSIRCYHRFKTDIIAFFQSRNGLLNLHPGTLPAYRGVMTTVRAMANREKNFGYSLHEINEDWDAGALVDVREQPIDYSKAMLNYMGDVWSTGVTMAFEATEKIARGQKLESLPQDESKSGYYTFPKKDELAEYRAQGIRLVDADGIQQIVIKSFAPEGGEEKLRSVVQEACRAWYEKNVETEETAVKPASEALGVKDARGILSH